MGAGCREGPPDAAAATNRGGRADARCEGRPQGEGEGGAETTEAATARRAAAAASLARTTVKGGLEGARHPRGQAAQGSRQVGAKGTVVPEGLHQKKLGRVA